MPCAKCLVDLDTNLILVDFEHLFLSHIVVGTIKTVQLEPRARGRETDHVAGATATARRVGHGQRQWARLGSGLGWVNVWALDSPRWGTHVALCCYD